MIDVCYVFSVYKPMQRHVFETYRCSPVILVILGSLIFLVFLGILVILGILIILVILGILVILIILVILGIIIILGIPGIPGITGQMYTCVRDYFLLCVPRLLLCLLSVCER